jgi:hypothetical protein
MSRIGLTANRRNRQAQGHALIKAYRKQCHCQPAVKKSKCRSKRNFFIVCYKSCMLYGYHFLAEKNAIIKLLIIIHLLSFNSHGPRFLQAQFASTRSTSTTSRTSTISPLPPLFASTLLFYGLVSPILHLIPPHNFLQSVTS